MDHHPDERGHRVAAPMIRPHFLLFLTIIPLSFVHGQDTGVRMRVLSSETRSPIAGALVSLHARTTATPVFRVFSDSTGAASIGSVPLGLYRLEIHHIGHQVGLKTVAEFVETEEVLDCLRKIGVEYAQGNYLHKPEPIATLLVRLQETGSLRP